MPLRPFCLYLDGDDTMKKICSLAAALLLLVTMLATSAFPATGNISYEDARKWEIFDKFCLAQFSCNVGTDPQPYPIGNSLTWDAEGTQSSTPPHGKYDEADASILIGRDDIIEQFLPSDLVGDVKVKIRHGYELPVFTYGNASFEQLIDGKVSFSYDYRMTGVSSGGGYREFVRMQLVKSALRPHPVPDNANRYRDYPEYAVMFDKDGRYIGKLELVITSTSSLKYEDDNYFYSPYYSFTEGDVTIEQEQFPVSLFIFSIETVEHSLTASAGEGGTISPEGESSVPAGTSATYTITANSGYMISEIIIDAGTDNETRVTPSGRYVAEYTLTADAPHTITAVFDEDSSAPVVTADEGITAAVTDVADGQETGFVSEFEAMGFTDGSRNVNVAADDMGGTFIADSDGFVRAAKLSVSFESGAGGGSMTISVPPARGESFDPERQYYMLVLNNMTNTYDLYEAAVTAGGRSVRGAAAARAAADGEAYLTATVSPASDYEPNTQLFVYSGVAETTGEEPSVQPAGGESKSGGGCNAGLGALALLALAPLALTRRKR